jgi:alpha-tubulin suppressor-like RCC1 family protein
MKKVLGFSASCLIISLLVSGCGGGGGNAFLTALQVSAGDSHTCAVQPSGQIKCWGDNTFGQLGDGTQFIPFGPVTVLGLSNAAEVSAGGRHTCALLNDGTVRCWGVNDFAQMGNGSILTPPFVFPTQVTGITTAISVSAGENHTCAVLSDGTIACWGDNSSGQLGDGTRNPTLFPVMVSGITGATPATTATDVSAGGSHTCALLADGSVFCWGDNTFGQLGNGSSFTDHPPSPGFSDIPIQANLTGATAISLAAGADHTCAVITGGTVRCWGDDTFGQIGQPYTSIGPGLPLLTFSTFPLPVPNLSIATGVTGGLDHSCATILGGGVQCWGDGSFGQLGFGGFFTPFNPILVAVPIFNVLNLSTADQVDAGANHTCAHLSNDVIECWGENNVGQLGSGNFTTSNRPIAVVD